MIAFGLYMSNDYHLNESLKINQFMLASRSWCLIRKRMLNKVFGEKQRVFYLSKKKGSALPGSFYNLTPISWNTRRVTVSDCEEALNYE